jgi:tetratricopeptide (TPR) repeat protein
MHSIASLRQLFLDAKTEAFREAASRMEDSFWQQSISSQCLSFLYLALVVKHEGDDTILLEKIEALKNEVIVFWHTHQHDAALDSYLLSELALVMLMLGEPEQAQTMLQNAIAYDDVSPYAYFRAGTVAAIEDAFETAKRLFDQGLAMMPNRAEAWVNLGYVLMRMADAEQGEAAFVQGWHYRPAHRGIASKAIEAMSESEQLTAYAEQIKQQIDEPSFASLSIEAQAGLLAQQALISEYENNTQEMLVSIQRAVKLDESNEEIRHLFVELFLGAERYWLLGERLTAWIETYDVYYEHLSLAQCSIEAGYLESAKQGLLAVKERAFGDPEWDNLWARCLMEEGEYSQAEQVLSAVLVRHEDYMPTVNLLADVLSSLGRIDEANELTMRVADLAPGPLLRLLENKKEVSEEDVERLRHWLDKVRDEEVRSNINFTLAHVLDKRKDYAQATVAIESANKAVWKDLSYDVPGFTKEIDEIMAGFDRRWLAGHQVSQVLDVNPIFIVGMPRSGTTLLEQIFAAHGKVFGGGELPYMSKIRMLAQKITKKAWPKAMLEASQDLIKDAAAYYIQKAQQDLKFTEPYLVDKMPHNFMDVMLIAAMFPNAKIIGLRRDYHAIALSNYFQNFSAKRGYLGYAFDLEAMGHHLKDFHRLMAHWQAEMPASQYREFHYEDLVTNPEQSIPEVLAFCGLDFTPELLEFYRNKTAVRTASVRQVRNPIYTDSVAKWKHYEAMLAPVIQVVESI